MLGDELEERQDACGADGGEGVGGAGEEEIQKTEADRVALAVESERREALVSKAMLCHVL